MIFHARIAGQIWEFNTDQQKALVRVEPNLNQEQKSVMEDSVCENIGNYLRINMGFEHHKFIRPTKIIYSKFPICNYVAPSPRADNPDFKLPCEAMAEYNEGKGYRCFDHRNT